MDYFIGSVRNVPLQAINSAVIFMSDEFSERLVLIHNSNPDKSDTARLVC